jgi:hypothetical protein
LPHGGVVPRRRRFRFRFGFGAGCLGELFRTPPVLGAGGVKLGFCSLGADSQRVAGLLQSVMRALVAAVSWSSMRLVVPGRHQSEVFCQRRPTESVLV